MKFTENEEIKDILYAVLEKAEREVYLGYSKFDGLHSPMTKALSFGFWPLRLLWTQVVMRSPINIRPLLFVKKGINPETMALFARSNLDMVAGGEQYTFAGRASRCLDWLLANGESGRDLYHGLCWGYHHPWQSPGFYQPPGFPNCYITVIVAEALLHGYRVLKDERYLQAARRACDFILNDLIVLHETDQEKSISYVPNMRTDFTVVNINALCAALLSQVGVMTGESILVGEARKLMNFVARLQTDYGAWYYTTDPRQSLVAHDNYHTGMILDAFLIYQRITGDERFRVVLDKGLSFYRERLFTAGGAPCWSSDKEFPYDAHGAGQGVLTFALAGDLQMSYRILSWSIDHFYKGDGEFSYQKGRLWDKNFTLLHWCNGWLARGLSTYLLMAAKDT
ncbi:MAG: hypothetical protein WCQ90_02815 [Deltaproteobacteria bacterium]